MRAIEVHLTRIYCVCCIATYCISYRTIYCIFHICGQLWVQHKQMRNVSTMYSRCNM